MPTNKNVPPFDSFDYEHASPSKHVGMGDGHLDAVFNPVKGPDRIAQEQYETHTWAPGRSGVRMSGEGAGRQGPVSSESDARVHSKLA
jgi:hypothetical protein